MSSQNSKSAASTFALAVAAIAISGVAVLLMPASAVSESFAASTDTYAGPAGYFPDGYVNQAREIEPMPVMYE